MTLDHVTFLRLAGLAQLSIAAGSVLVPRYLKWPEELARLSPLTRRVFWTYAGYIFGTNVAGGLLALLAAPALTAPSFLGAVVSGYLTMYWGSRLALQFFCFGPVAPPRTPITRLGEVAFTSAFALITGVFAFTFAHGLGS
jgi:hypothetical protein